MSDLIDTVHTQWQNTSHCEVKVQIHILTLRIILYYSLSLALIVCKQVDSYQNGGLKETWLWKSGLQSFTILPVLWSRYRVGRIIHLTFVSLHNYDICRGVGDLSLMWLMYLYNSLKLLNSHFSVTQYPVICLHASIVCEGSLMEGCCSLILLFHIILWEMYCSFEIQIYLQRNSDVQAAQ